MQAWTLLGEWTHRGYWSTHERATPQPNEGAPHHPARAPDSRDDCPVYA